jgi:ABC-type Zn2+ transport system substrate-binding protein/surface adhesin
LTFILSVFETFLTAAVSNTDQSKALAIMELRKQKQSSKTADKEEDKEEDSEDENDRFK